jgi:hypothetical protein
MATIVSKLVSDSSYASKIYHLEGEKVFGLVKQKKKFPLGLEGDSHKHTRAIFHVCESNSLRATLHPMEM